MARETTQDVELCRIMDTFGKWEKREFLVYVWSTEFAEWDAKIPTDSAVQRANEVEARAAYLWNRDRA